MGSPYRMSSCHYNARVAKLRKVILFFVVCVYHTENACCETVISGRFVTLSCSLPSSGETVEWIAGTDEYSMTVSMCEANRCYDDIEYMLRSGLRFFALRNSTFSWITVSSESQRNYIVTCRLGDDMIQSFNLTFLDADMIQTPRCDVFPYDEKDTSKIKFQCVVDNTQGIEAELEIIGAGESIAESPDLVYSIVNYNHFIDASNVMCRLYVLGINKSCRCPQGIRIIVITETDEAVFEIEANFEIDELVIDWQLMEIDKTVVDTTSYSLWYGDEKNSMLFRNFRSIRDTEGIIVKCQITRTDENQNISTVVGVGFVSLASQEIEHSRHQVDNFIIFEEKIDHKSREDKLNVMFTYMFLGLWSVYTLVTIVWFTWKTTERR